MRTIKYRNTKTTAYIYHAFREVDGMWNPLCGRVGSHHFDHDAHGHPDFIVDEPQHNGTKLCQRCVAIVRAERA